MPTESPRIRAARLHTPGKPLVVEEIPPPEPGDGEVAVDMAFGGVNPVDRYMAEGRVAPDAPLPRTLGMEGSGRRVGDGRPVLVQGAGLATRRDGAWAGRVVVPAAALTDIPDGVDLAEAAAMGVAGVTAWRTATELARVTADDRVLVLGASGGVGSILVSICSALGARVWGQTGNPDKAGFVTAQGADEVVTAGPGDLAAAVEPLGPTVVFDALGDGFSAAAVEALGPFGRLVSFGVSAGPVAEINMQSLYRKGLTVHGYAGLIEPEERMAAGRAAALAALADGRLRVAVGQRLPLERVNEAFAALVDRAVTGKIVLELGGAGGA
ncbi:MAG TPA: zinc-binding alcohol dehydrogenase family protein [Acidimicrobiia bacterium]|nr:zinc-binding alcohol dehydrogenase family protein [Acidimicrobiia bacterium]